MGKQSGVPLWLPRFDPDRLANRRAVHQPDLFHLSQQDRHRLLRHDRVRRTAVFPGAEPGGDDLRPGHRHRRRHSARRRDGAHPLARLGARPADQCALRDAAGRGRAAAGAVVRHLSESQDHRGVLVRGVPGPDQYLSGRARVRQEHAGGRAIVPLDRMEDVAGRAAAVRAALHHRRHPARHRPRADRHDHRGILHHDHRPRFHDDAATPTSSRWTKPSCR